MQVVRRLPPVLDADPLGRVPLLSADRLDRLRPRWVFGMASASLTYEFFIHTELVKRVGWLDWLINTPSAHRVHHASNPEYVDKNLAAS